MRANRFLRGRIVLFLAAPLLVSGCAGLIVGGLCVLSGKPGDYTTRHYETRVQVETTGGKTELGSRYECTPTEYRCFQGAWRASYAGRSVNRLDDRLEVRLDGKTLMLLEPGCSESEDAGIEWTPLWRPQEAWLVGERSSQRMNDELEGESALAVYGVRVQRIEVRRFAP